MKKKLFLIILLLVLVNSVNAQDEIFSAESAKINLDISSVIEIKPTSLHSEVNEINAMLYLFPKKDQTQNIENIKTDPDAKFDPEKINFRWLYPKENELDFNYNSDIFLNSKFNFVDSKITYPLPYGLIPEDIRVFTKSSDHIDSDDSEIQQLAKNMAQYETDQWTIVSKIGFWVKKNVKYDISTLTEKANQKASWVLQNKQGVCDEITNLFIAMLRSLGIPARFVTGIAYTNERSFQQQFVSHGWAEVYFHQVGWVPFDITYGQFGWVDVGHIKFKETNDENGLGYEIKSRGTDINVVTHQLNFKVNVLETKGSNKDVEIKSSLFKKNVKFGSFNVIEIEVENSRDYFVSTELFLAKVNEFESIEENVKQLILAPKEKQRQVLKIRINNDLDKTKLYEMPVVVYTGKNETSNNVMQASANEKSYDIGDISKEIALFLSEEKKLYSKQVEAICKPIKERAYIGEEREINCEITNNGDDKLKYLSVCIERDCKDLELNPRSNSSLTFNRFFDYGGFNNILLTINSKDITKRINFYVEALDDSKIEIADLKYPELVEPEQRVNVSFKLKKISYSVPQSIKVELQNLRKEALITQEKIEKDQEFEFLLSEDQLYDDNIEIIVTYKDEFGKEFQEKREITLNRGKSGFFQSIWRFLKAFWRNLVDTFT